MLELPPQFSGASRIGAICRSMLIAACLSLASIVVVHAQTATPDEFRRLYSWVQGGSANVIANNLADLMGWNKSEDMPSRRRSFSRRKDGVLVSRYAVDIFPRDAPAPYLLVTEVKEWDTTVCFLFNSSGQIGRVFELFPDRNWDVEEVQGDVYHNLGYDIWRSILTVVPNETK